MYEQYTDKQIVEMLKPKLAKLDWGKDVDSIYHFPETCKMIATIYRSAYIRGQLGRNFIIGEKKERDSAIVFQVGDSVKLINRKGIDKESNRYYPPIGTTGKVVELGSDYCFVQWPKGITADDGVWACPNHFLKKVTEHWVPATRDNIKVGSKVRYLNAERHAQDPEFYPLQGTIGEAVTACDDDICIVRWPNYKNTWYVSRFDLEVLLCE